MALLNEIVAEMDNNEEGIAPPLQIDIVPVDTKAVAKISLKMLEAIKSIPELGEVPADHVINGLIMTAAVLAASKSYDNDVGEAFGEMLSRTGSVVTAVAYATRQIEEPEPTDSEVEEDTEITPVS